MIKEISKTEFSTIAFHENKRRFYHTFEGFWAHSVERDAQAKELFRILYEQLPERISALLDFSKLKIMQPQVAEIVYPDLIWFLEIKQAQAIAVIQNPDNVLAKLQAERIATTLEHIDRQRIALFTNRDEAEAWLDKTAP